MLPSNVNDCARAALACLFEALCVSTVAGGTADALTVTYTNIPTAPSTLVDGMAIRIRAIAANATTTPTLAINGGTARTIVKKGGTALVAGDIAGNLAQIDLVYNLANTRWELLNPTFPAAVATKATMQTGTDNATIVTPARVNDSDSAAKAWLFANSSGVIQASYNIASVTRNSAGNYTVNFTTGFATANYAAVPGLEVAAGTANAISTVPGGRAAGSCIVQVYNSTNGVGADAAFSLVCYGRQA